MKKIMFIFSIYLLVLPGLACAGTDSCIDEQKYSISQTGDHAEDETGDCGSFCACSCCVHIVTVNFISPGFTVISKLSKNGSLISYNNISLPSNYFGNIWQPPRVSL